MNCPLCSSTNSRVVAKLHDDRYGYPGKFSVMKCKKCSHMFLDHRFSKQQAAELYSTYYPKTFVSTDSYTPHKEKNAGLLWWNGEKSDAFRWVPMHSHILDIGCGFCETMGYHQLRGCDVCGIDTNINILPIAKEYEFNVQIAPFSSALFPKKTFDVVTFDQVIEHIEDPVAFLKDVKKVLKPNGVVIFTTPNFAGWSVKVFGEKSFLWHIPYHQQFFTLKTIQEVAKKAGMRIVSCQTITNSEWFFYQLCHAAVYPKEGKRSQFFTDEKKTLRTKILLGMIFFIHKTGISHILSRMLDACSLGDNIVVKAEIV